MKGSGGPYFGGGEGCLWGSQWDVKVLGVSGHLGGGLYGLGGFWGGL